MPLVPFVILLVAAALAAAQLALQTDQLLLTVLLLGPVLPARALARLRSAPARLATVRVRAPTRRGLR
jgi:predicted glycosyltransferase